MKAVGNSFEHEDAMSEIKLALDDLIDGEIETIMYTCAPQSVKDKARERLKALRAQLSTARARLERHPQADRYCVRCGGFGWLTYADADAVPCSCTSAAE